MWLYVIPCRVPSIFFNITQQLTGWSETSCLTTACCCCSLGSSPHGMSSVGSGLFLDPGRTASHPKYHYTDIIIVHSHTQRRAGLWGFCCIRRLGTCFVLFFFQHKAAWGDLIKATQQRGRSGVSREAVCESRGRGASTQSHILLKKEN